MDGLEEYPYDDERLMQWRGEKGSAAGLISSIRLKAVEIPPYSAWLDTIYYS